jgi:uncharacterized protein
VTVSTQRNHLDSESSPYLLQHAGNPVDWYPWGAPALDRARREQRPIFLSIGYAACHWCHVMEKESFEDPAVAAYLNAHFVAIKVDREERPDIDAVYMAAVQALTGSGGWPLSVFLTPDAAPFFGGTYFPPDRRWGRSSFLDVLEAVADAWQTRRRQVEEGAAELTLHLRATPTAGDDGLDVGAAEERAMSALARSFDSRAGGFGSAPKFPTAARLYFLLDRATRGDDTARTMLATTLDGMAAGGMWDWVGGGFHRYSVDADWLVPHFEKMLYDNALLARVYGEAATRLGEPRWMDVARRTAEYLLREMRGPEGGFFSSTDADSAGEEGRFFTWTPAEVRAALPADEAEAVVRACSLDGTPNFESGRFVLRPLTAGVDGGGAPAGAPVELGAVLERARERLYEARLKRLPPATDDKRLAAWNGMTIWSLAWLGATLGEPSYQQAARGAARHVLDAMHMPDGRVARSWRHGRLTGAETLEDVAWISAGLLELYQTDGDTRWLASALDLVTARLPQYLDASGALHDAPADGEPLPARPRDPADGALPASITTMATVLLRLAALTGRETLARTARAAIATDAGLAARAAEACTTMVLAARLAARPPVELVVVGDPASPLTDALLRTARSAPRPPDVIAPSPTVPVPADVASLVPLFAGREGRERGAPRAYLCRGGACALPTSDPAELARDLAAHG